VLPLVIGGYRALTGKLRELADREAVLRAHVEELDRSRRELERETARLEGQADAKQRELARVEARLQQLPKLDQALGAARAQAEAAQAEASRREQAERRASERASALEAELAAAREALAQASEREASALTEAGRAAGERDTARARVARLEEQVAAAQRDAVAHADALARSEAARRQAEERRAALERELRDRGGPVTPVRASAPQPGAEAARDGSARGAAR
jgi:chromosome segregation ATPase